MVKYYDDKAVYDASVEEIWNLLDDHSDENLPNIHPVFHSVHTVYQGDDGTSEREVEMETPDGGAEKGRMRMTPNPPHALTIEYLDGPLKGSWFTNTYVPEGKQRTRVVCTGEFHLEGVDDEKALEIGARMVDERFNEDLDYLHKNR